MGFGKHHCEQSSEGDGIPADLFQILKDDAVKVLHSICQQTWDTQQWPQERLVFIPISKNSNAKEYSNYHTTALISHASKVVLKILQARLQLKLGLKLNIQKTKIMASGPITSWQIDGETMKQRQILFSWAPKSLQMVTAAIKRHLLLGRKAMTNLDSILKSRDITLPPKVHIVKAMGFFVVLSGCES